VRLALGSDVAAGPDLAMPRDARQMIEVAKLRAMTVDPVAVVPTPADAWRQITRGNAEALGWADAGRLEPGAAADLLVLRAPIEIDAHLIGRLIYTWSDDYIEHRVVAGQLH
jgi:guanine deaminase